MIIPLQVLKKINACRDSLAWVRQQKTRSIRKLWATCPNGSWLCYLLKQLMYDTSVLRDNWLTLLASESRISDVRENSMRLLDSLYANNPDSVFKYYERSVKGINRTFTKSNITASLIYANAIRKIVPFEEIQRLLKRAGLQ